MNLRQENMAGLAALQASVSIITFSYKAARHIGAQIGWSSQVIAAVESRLDRLSMLLEHHGLATCTSPAIKLALRDLVLDLAAIAAIWRKAMKLQDESAWTNFWATKDNYAAALDRLSRSVDDLTLFIVVDIHDVVTERQVPIDDKGAEDASADHDTIHDEILSQHADALVTHLHDLVDDLNERLKPDAKAQPVQDVEQLTEVVTSILKVLPKGPPAPQPEPLPGLPFPNATFVLSVSSAQESSYILLSNCFEGAVSSEVTFVKPRDLPPFRFRMVLDDKAVGCGGFFKSYDKDMTLVPQEKGVIFWAKKTMVDGQVGFELDRIYTQYTGRAYRQAVVLRQDKDGNPRLQAASSWRRNEVAHFVCSPVFRDAEGTDTRTEDIVLRANQIVSKNGRGAAAARYDNLAQLAEKVDTGTGRSARAFLAGLMAKAAPAAGVISPAIDCAATLKEIFK